MRLVNDDELILVERTLQFMLICIRPPRVLELNIVRQFLEGQALNEQLEAVQEFLPGSIAQCCRTDQQCTLAFLAVELQYLPGNECLAQSNFIRDDRAAGIADQPERAGDTMLLEAG